MVDDPDFEVARQAAAVRSGSIVAAAGCGKTEQIARATAISDGRRLILTHTHAGVDALRQRLKKLSVPKTKYRIDTIAGWCLWYTASYPKRSGVLSECPVSEEDWRAVYTAGVQLLQSGAIERVLDSSYSGVFVDEYQDCSLLQHHVIKKLAERLSVCVFGDPLQSIFDFNGQKPVDWESDVYPVFQKTEQLVTPWRWKNTGNDELAEWLAELRVKLEGGYPVDLTNRPKCVAWHQLPSDPQSRQSRVIGICKAVIGNSGTGNLAVIGDPVNIYARTSLAQKLARAGFSNLEPINCTRLYSFAQKIEAASGFDRLEKAVDFVCACMTGAEKSLFLKAIRSRDNGKKPGSTYFGDLIPAGLAIVEGSDAGMLLRLLLGFRSKADTYIFCREMFFTMCSALQIQIARPQITLTDAIWEVQNRVRHSGRKLPRRSIGSTLLLKGLEFDHSVIIQAASMNRKDWYVALTRATTSVTVLSSEEYFSVDP
jgi:hypothetical protein